MKQYGPANRIVTLVRMLIAACVLFLLPVQSVCAADDVYSREIIFTAPSAEKIYDGKPLTEQIDVTAQGLPEGYTYKAVAKGSVTHPDENTENNNIVTDYMIFDPSGLNVTDRFTNVVLRPGTLRVSYVDSDVLGAKRNENGSVVRNIIEENTALSAMPSDEVSIYEGETAKNSTYMSGYNVSLEIILYSFLMLIMIAVFIMFVLDSGKARLV